MTRALSDRQEQVMLAIQRDFARTGRSPTLEAIGKEVGITSKGRVHNIISELVALGHLERDANRSRGLRIVKPIPDDRFEEAARAACAALQCAASPDNIARARDAIAATLMPEAKAA
ncbi:MAG: hypothetical protein KJZ75_11530 [Hyphomonadaceae bacterium]|nr:hypothetical protein [Hyphomonadaceae bacterium]